MQRATGSRDVVRQPSFRCLVVSMLLALVCGRAAAQDEPVLGVTPTEPAPAEAPAPDATAATQAPAEAPAPDATAATPAPAVVDEQPAAEQPAADSVPWDLRHRAYNTFEGSTGGLYTIDPGMAVPGAVRLQLAFDSYSGDSFFYDGDEVEQNRQFLSVSWTALDLLEIFTTLQNRATVADEPAPNSLHALGDLQLGIKLRAEPIPFLRVGGGLRLGVLNDIGEQETLLDATNIGLTAAAALDLQRLDQPIPVIARLNVDYLFDNSAKVLDDVENVRFNELEDPDDPEDETRHLVSRVERFGLGVNRVDMLTLALGVEVPLAVGGRFFLHPMADFRFGLPINRQGYDCAFFSTDEDRGTNEPGADDTCIDDAGSDAFPMNLAVGARFVPPVRGLSVLLGADFGLSGTDTFVRELSGVAPFRILIALGYDYDARPQEEPSQLAAPAGPLAPLAPTRGRLIGKVVDQASGAPVSGAVVSFAGLELSPVATDAGGTFTSYELAPGEIELELSHPNYEARRCATVVPPAGGEVQVSCSMAPLPSTGSAKGTVRDVYGAVIAGARVHITGPSTQTTASDVVGDFTVENLPAGDYTARAESSSHLTRAFRFSVAARQQTRLDIALVPRPDKPGAVLAGIEIRAPALRFVAGSSELEPAGAQAVAEVADLLLREPARRVRIAGDGGEGLALGRALAIKQRLIDAGVLDTRIEIATEPAKQVTLTFVQ